MDHNTQDTTPTTARPPFDFTEDLEDDCEFVLPPECQIQQETPCKRVSFDTTRNQYIVIRDTEEMFEEAEKEEELQTANRVYYSRVAHDTPAVREERGWERIEVLDKIESRIIEKDNSNDVKDNSNDMKDKNNDVKDKNNDVKDNSNNLIEEMSESQKAILKYVSNIKFSDRLNENTEKNAKITTSEGNNKITTSENPCMFNKETVDNEIIFEEPEESVIIENISRIENNPFIVQDKLKIKDKQNEK